MAESVERRSERNSHRLGSAMRMTEVPTQPPNDDVEVTTEMIEAGLRAWQASAGAEYPRRSFINDLVEEDIYRAMRKAAAAPPRSR